jgi:RNA methyltransferase, TrmH family
MALSRARTRLLARLQSRRTREREGRVLAEGLRVAGEVLDSGAGIDFAVVSPRAEELGGGPLVERLRGAGVEVIEVDDREAVGLASTETSQGLLLVCREPFADVPELLSTRARVLVLDGVQDPGNAGTLVRTAAAFGLTGVIALDGTVDPWNPKAVRAAAGTCFRLPLVRASWADVAPRLRDAGVALWVADAGGEPVPAVPPPRPWGLVVGSEGSGPRPEILAAAHRRVSVPMPGGTESLNAGVAGAILLFALTRGDHGA